MLETSSGGSVARVAREILIVHRDAQTPPVVIVAANDRDPIVVAGGWIDAVRRETRVKVSGAFVDAAVDRVVENRGPEKVKRAFRLRLIDILAFASAAAMVQRRENRHRGKTRRNIIGGTRRRRRRERGRAIRSDW